MFSVLRANKQPTKIDYALKKNFWRALIVHALKRRLLVARKNANRKKNGSWLKMIRKSNAPGRKKNKSVKWRRKHQRWNSYRLKLCKFTILQNECIFCVTYTNTLFSILKNSGFLKFDCCIKPYDCNRSIMYLGKFLKHI